MKDFKELLGKFWKGTSKLDEEKELKDHFSKNKNHQIENKFFSYLKHKKSQKINDPEFDEEILQLIKGKQDVKRSLFHKINWQIAAAIVLLFTAGAIYLNKQTSNGEYGNSPDQLVIVDTYDDPQIAYEETKKALLLISAKLNKGSAYTAKIAKFNQSQEILRKEK